MPHRSCTIPMQGRRFHQVECLVGRFIAFCDFQLILTRNVGFHLDIAMTTGGNDPLHYLVGEVGARDRLFGIVAKTQNCIQ